MMNKIRVIKAGFSINTTYMNAVFSERESSYVEFDALFNGDLKSVRAIFSLTARLQVTHLNFWESNYNNYEVLGSDNSLCGIYQVENSSWEGDRNLFDPRNRFNLAHILIVGNDSYVEVFGNKDFTVIPIDT